MKFKNKIDKFLPGTNPPTPAIAQFTVIGRIVPAQGGFRVRPVITAQDASGKNVNPPLGFPIPADVLAAYEAACNAAVDQCATLLAAFLGTYGYNQ